MERHIPCGRFACSLAFGLLLAAALPAHGGQYRGPWNAPPTPPPWNSPIGPATGGMGPVGPVTGSGRPMITDGTSWQVWWEFSKDPLLSRRSDTDTGPVTGSDEFYLGVRAIDPSREVMQPSEQDRRDRITTALWKALQAENNRDVVTACLVALAKVGIDPAGTTLPAAFVPYVGEGDQEVRETATLSFGIAGASTAQERLAALVQQTAAGRKLAAGDVSDRVRTFAAWSLGLMAGRSPDIACKQRSFELLVAVLKKPDENSRDLRVGAIEGLGLLAPDPLRSGAEKRLLWTALEELWAYYGKDLGKGDQLVQAHAPTAVARLLGRGTSSEHQRAKALLADELGGGRRRHNAIYQSAALALGRLCLPCERHADDAPFAEVLLKTYQRGNDQLTRFFSLLALGRIGGDQNRKTLLDLYEAANKTIERPWIALALGLIARERRLDPRGQVDLEVGKLLLRDLQMVDYDDAQAAYALACGLCGYEPAAETMQRLLDERTRSETLGGYLAIGLAMLDHKPAADQLVELLKKSLHRPFLLQQCALALGRLGDARVVPLLLEMLEKCESAAALSAVAMALGQIRDKRSIDPLAKALLDPERTKLARAFAAVALGSIGDKDLLPWNSAIAVDINYMATVDTLTNGSTGVLDIL